MSVEFLKQLPLFESLPDQDLAWLYQQARPIAIKAGEVLIQEGDSGDSLYIILDGEFSISKRSAQQDIELDLREPGAVIGEMSLLDHAPRSATVKAVTDGRLLMIQRDIFDELLSTSPSAALAILHTVTARLRQNEALLHQREKMAGLGTLAAGLAHELNNPAAAAQRSAGLLRDTLANWQQLGVDLDHLDLTPEQATTLHELREQTVRPRAATAQLDPLARSDLESELQTWLEAHGVDEAWDLAPILINYGLDVAQVEPLTSAFTTDQLPVLLRWLGAGYSVYSLLDEVITSAERIAEIVKAVKSYSYLDQAPLQEVNVHDGLESTLVILKHKLKQGVAIKREFAGDLPRIEAYASELNQIWTNIVDNAIDAMNGQGEIRLRTYADDPFVVVEICDNGPGIPPNIQSRIFEPFFTTKPPGIGTGLGLNIAYNIVNKHRGQIKVDSRPGQTCFQVRLPQRLN
jgi:signal transduction histidine kinase